jgi:hypothetical protein
MKVLVPAESEVIAPFLRYCARTIAMDDTDVKVPFEGQYRHRTREHGIEAPMGFIAPKGTIDSGVVDLLSPILVLLNRQFFPILLG